jgi:hypothetical protein
MFDRESVRERCLTVSPLLLLLLLLLALHLFPSHRICAKNHLHSAVLVKNRVCVEGVKGLGGLW